MTKNLLGSETSPYLLQHKDNPVHWRPWGAEALAEARAADKPILLSIGYAACHWCHVMAHESFEDEEVAAVMNALFVNIKVDREERPDIDTIYMQALHHLGEQGGWPLTMFLTPDGEPFWGGTYFPKTPRYGRPGFIQVLEEVDRIFRQEPEKIALNREALLQRLKDAAATSGSVGLSEELLDTAARKLLGVVDPIRGGTQGAPKFPQTAFLELLWRAGQRIDDPRFQQSVDNALSHMAQGGIYDHVGGGFARYSVDEHWLVPHFEKMLYDNALLIDLMTLVWRQTGSPLLEARIRETIAWMMRELKDDGGAFHSSLDADSEGEEGKFYVWSADELRQVLGQDYELFAGHYDVSEAGNWEGHIILNRSHSPDWQGERLEDELAALRETLRVTRETRIRPGLDDKVLADWNGLAIAALAHAGFVLNEDDWLDEACAAFDFVTSQMSEGNRLLHSYRKGRAAQRGLLSDYANMMRAGLVLQAHRPDRQRFGKVNDWYEVLERLFLAPDGSYFMSANDADDLIVRPRSGADDATPNGNAVMAEVCLRLWHMTGEARFRERADAIFRAFAGQALGQLFGFATLFNSFDFALHAVELVVAEPEPDTSRGTALLGAQRMVANPNIVTRRIEDGEALPAHHPATGKTSVDGLAAAYVCTTKGCSLPVTQVNELAGLLRR